MSKSEELTRGAERSLEALNGNLVLIDPAARRIIQQVYDYLKNKERNRISIIEKLCLTSIEHEFILTDSTKIKQQNIKWLVHVLERLSKTDFGVGSEDNASLLNRAVENAKSLEDSIEVESFLLEFERFSEKLFQLDYNQRSMHLLSDVSSYAKLIDTEVFIALASSLEMIAEKVSVSTVSQKVFNTVLGNLSTAAVIVASVDGRIRFVSRKGEELIGQKNISLIHQPVSYFLKEIGDGMAMLKVFLDDQYYKSIQVLVEKETLSAETTEVKEIVYVISELETKSTTRMISDHFIEALRPHINSDEGRGILADLQAAMQTSLLLSKEDPNYLFTNTMSAVDFIEAKLERYKTHPLFSKIALTPDILPTLDYNGSFRTINEVLDLMMGYYVEHRGNSVRKLKADFVATNLSGCLILSLATRLKGWSKNAPRASESMKRLSKIVAEQKGNIQLDEVFGGGNRTVVFLPF